MAPKIAKPSLVKVSRIATRVANVTFFKIFQEVGPAHDRKIEVQKMKH